MAVQAGLDTSVTLNIEPRFLLAGPMLRGTVLTLVGSVSDPASANAGTKNIWENGFEGVIDAELSANAGGSDVAWYLAADSAVIDTVEYAYLEGMDQPVFETQMSFDRLGMKHRCYQAFATKALDFRGLQKHQGE